MSGGEGERGEVSFLFCIDLNEVNDTHLVSAAVETLAMMLLKYCTMFITKT